ncbi:hypothetical protein [Streptomyces sp. NBC_01618]|uniref:hypothetical protein n=1 Tax=Streptomyces sp. NBC_01618 TaxID=2975900 RepID=UPI00386CDA98|nr:cytochrome P450 [Streptomyces sp. NBC_01618]
MSEIPVTLPMPFDDEFYADPYQAYAELNKAAPIHRISTPSGAAVWLLTGYEEARDGLKNKRLARHQSHAGPDYQQDVIPGPMRRAI